ncbi:MAG: protoporphyrinogen oxidase [Actinomycetota bacterium]
MTQRVVVVGGGITGLAVAHRLKGRAEVMVIESAERPGGKFDTIDLDGITFERGPDSFVAREQFVPRLAEEVGLGGQLVAPAIFGAQIWSGGKLKRVPGDFVFGMPGSPLAALRSGMLTPFGALRAGADLALPGPLTGPDVSVGEFVRRRFGNEVLEKLVDPLLAGTRAGRADEISLAAAVPQIDALARANRSLVRGLTRARRRGHTAAGPPPFLAPRAGMRSLIEALEDDLAGTVQLRTSATVTRIERAGDGYSVHLDGVAVEAGTVVLAVPAYSVADILRDLNPQASGELARIPYATAATAALVFPPGSLTIPSGVSGMLVPSGEHRTLAAATWFSSKWPHLAPSDGRIVVKAFAGRAAGDATSKLDDERLVAALVNDLGAAMGVNAAPLATHLTRWERALPQYEVGHLVRVERVEAALRATPGIMLAGAAYRGSGISDCVKSAERAAQQVLHAAG